MTTIKCVNCGQQGPVGAGGECSACYQFRRRTGRARPLVPKYRVDGVLVTARIPQRLAERLKKEAHQNYMALMDFLGKIIIDNTEEKNEAK